MRLYRGTCTVIGRESAHALYDERFVTFGEDDVYQQSDAAGFIRLFALPSRVRAVKDQEMSAASNGLRETGAGGVASTSGGGPDAAPVSGSAPEGDAADDDTDADAQPPAAPRKALALA